MSLWSRCIGLWTSHYPVLYYCFVCGSTINHLPLASIYAALKPVGRLWPASWHARADLAISRVSGLEAMLVDYETPEICRWLVPKINMDEFLLMFGRMIIVQRSIYVKSLDAGY